MATHWRLNSDRKVHFGGMRTKPGTPLQWGVAGILLVVATFIAFELTIMVLLDNASVLPKELLPPFREYYLKRVRNTIQYLPECARYDPHLAYTLKPGTCRVSEREFEIDYTVNSMGLRDDEVSLDSPEIIILGDSHSIGWGVSQNETFAARLERKTGKKVLNAAMSSYGTVRELKMLERLDLDRLEYIILQYCSNDISENRTYIDNGNLPIMSEETYNNIAIEHSKLSEYYFMKHSVSFIQLILRTAMERVEDLLVASSNVSENQEATPEGEANVFLAVLEDLPDGLENVHLIVFEINGYAMNDADFISQAKRGLEFNPLLNDRLSGVSALDFSTELSSDDYYVLDDHLRGTGHRKISDAIVERIHQLEVGSSNTAP